MTQLTRCGWAGDDPIMQQYHDTQWGIPVHDDTLLFEMLTLEGAQAGLSWSTILKRREGYRSAFANFDVHKVAQFTDEDVERLMQDKGIIRNRLKVSSTISNAHAFIAVQKEFGSFDKYIWSFVKGKPIMNKFSSMKEVPAETELSKLISKDLKKRGFRFVGPTIVYAYMQATGIVNDHLATCHCRTQKK